MTENEFDPTGAPARLARLKSLSPAAKAGLVAGGYAAALAVAALAVMLSIALTGRVDRQASGGMTAFGDALLFLGVFGVGAVPPTAAALFFLRPWAAFWTAFAGAAAAVAVTALVAPLAWPMLAPLRALLSPPLAGLFAAAGFASPARRPRLVLWGCAAAEAVAFAAVAARWFLR